MTDLHPPTDAPPIDTFGVALPPEWIRVPLDTAGFEGFVREQRARLTAPGGVSRTAERQFELILRQLRNDCRRENVTLAALMALPIAGSGELIDLERAGGADAPTPADVVGVLAATCTISAISTASVGTDLPLTVHTIAAAMARRPDTTDEGVEVIDLETPAIITLPAGPAVKLVRVHRHPSRALQLAPGGRGGPTHLEIFAHHVLVPYDDGRRAAVVTFSSPNCDLARPLSELFDEIAATFRMFGGDDPTDPLA